MIEVQLEGGRKPGLPDPQAALSSATALAYEAGTPTGDGSGIRLDKQSVAGWSAAPKGVRPGFPAFTVNASRTR